MRLLPLSLSLLLGVSLSSCRPRLTDTSATWTLTERDGAPPRPLALDSARSSLSSLKGPSSSEGPSVMAVSPDKLELNTSFGSRSGHPNTSHFRPRRHGWSLWLSIAFIFLISVLLSLILLQYLLHRRTHRSLAHSRRHASRRRFTSHKAAVFFRTVQYVVLEEEARRPLLDEEAGEGDGAGQGKRKTSLEIPSEVVR